MRPLKLSLPIQIAEKAFGDATQFQWFDCEKLSDEDIVSGDTWIIKSQLPFDNCAVYWPLKSAKFPGHSAILFLKSEGEQRTGIYVAMIFDDGEYIMFPPFSYCIQDNKVHMMLPDNTKDTQITANSCMDILNRWFYLLSRGSESYELTIQKSAVNQRRITDGKRPIYDWRTVLIGAVKTKSTPQGGHHAPPRQHDRRGHLRRYKSGKTVWVRATKVGKASDGFVFHDYAVA